MSSLGTVLIVLRFVSPMRAAMEINEGLRDEHGQPLGCQMGRVEASVMIAP